MDEVLFNLIGVVITIVIVLIIGIGFKKDALGVFILFVGAIGLLAYNTIAPNVNGEESRHEVYLYSLKNSQEVNGSFTLGSGSVETTEYYYYYYRTNLGYTRGKIPVHNTYLVETDNRRPELVSVRDTYSQEGFVKWIPDYEAKHHILYVPKNTVIQKFNAY